MGNYGLKIVLEGKSIESTNARDYLVWSKYRDFKIIKKSKNVLTITDGNSTASKQIPHGLGYPPAYFYWIDLHNNGTYYMAECFSGVQVGSSNGHSTTDSEIDISELSFVGNRDTSVGDESMPFSYVLFDQKAIGAYSGNDKPIGYISADYGLKVSEQGKNVFTARLHEQIMNSNLEALQYHSTRTVGLAWDNTNNGSNTASIVHGLGYVPIFLVWGNFGANCPTVEFQKDSLLPRGTQGNPFISAAWANTSEIRVEIGWAGGGTSSGVFNARVVIFKNQLLN